MDALDDQGFKYELDYQNAQASPDILAAIADIFIAKEVDLILAIATPTALTTAGKTTSIPILGTAITDYVYAKLAKSNEAPGFNVSGTTNMNPVAEQIGLLQRLVPNAKTVGILYTGSEPNSVLQAEIATQVLQAAGIQVKETKINNSNDVQQAITSMVDQVDAI